MSSDADTLLVTMMAAKRLDDASPAQETQVIYPDGDVILCTGSGDSAQRFLVSSFFLKNASAVFTAMFSDEYAEGKKLSTSPSAPVEVELEDDGKTLRVMLLLLHMRHGSLPGTVTIKDLLSLAVLSDKYDCADAIRLVTGLWFVNLRSSESSFAEKGQLLEAAYLFKNAEEFRYRSKQLVAGHIEPLATLMNGRLPLETLRWCPKPCSLITRPLTLIVFMERQRSTAHRDLCNTFRRMRTETSYCCQYAKSRDTNGVNEDKEKALYDVVSGSCDLACAALTAYLPNLPTERHLCNSCGTRAKGPSTTQGSITLAVRTAQFKCRGLCLQCVVKNDPAPDACLQQEH